MRNIKVLLVEDEEVLANNIATYLGRHEFDIRVAADARGALAIVSGFRPAIIVVDFLLPGLDGLQTIDAIRARVASCGCVLMTGHPSDSVLAGVRERGIREVLFKPFPLSELLDALRRGAHILPRTALASGITDRAPWERRRTDRRAEDSGEFPQPTVVRPTIQNRRLIERRTKPPGDD